MNFEPRVMERGRGQVMHRYRPDQTFDHTANFMAQVKSFGRDDAYGGPSLDIGYLVDQALRFVARWRFEGKDASGAAPGSDRTPGFPPKSPLEREQYEVVIPGKVFCRVWPLVVRCANSRCGMVWLTQEPSPGDKWPPACPRCRHANDTRQLQYVFVHNCGEIRPMMPSDRCPRCHGSHFRLNDKVSRFMGFRWECIDCQTPLPVQAFCSNPRCEWPNKMMSPQVHTSSSAYAGQGLTLVNVPSAEHAKLRSMPIYVLGSIARWLGICDDDVVERMVAGGDKPVPPEVADAIRAMEAAGLEPQAEKLRRRFVPVDVQAVREQVIDKLGFDPMGEEERAADLAANLDVYERVMGLPLVTIRQIEDAAATAGRATLYKVAYRPALQRAGLEPDGVILVTQFPATRLAIGYSRNGFKPQEADLVPYSGRVGKGQTVKTVLYAYPTDTEALVFRMSPERVHRWLERNAFASAEEIDHEGGVLRWFARELEGYDGQSPPWSSDESDPSGPRAGARALFRLLHSLAHQVLRALAVDSGFSEAGLSEYLFPFALAFAIHPNGGNEFTIGGLRTVMEQSLSDVLNRAVENDQCLYDPHCMQSNRGADNGCLFLPETACQLWNHFLSRWELFGGLDGTIGYWDPKL